MAQREEKIQLQIPTNTSLHIGIVRARFNSEITNAQNDSAISFCTEYGIAYDEYTVDGCYEIPFVLQHWANQKKYNALVALGCLIKGETIHFDVISYSVAHAIQDIMREKQIPIGFGIITANTKEQAIARTVIGYDAAAAAVGALLQTE